MITALIVDDEIDAIGTIENFINDYCKNIDFIHKADSVASAIKSIKENKPDIVFLDINMRDGSGFDVLEKVDDEKFKTIFTTAYDEYAIKAFKVNATDYLLKPINPNDLQAAVEKAIKSMSEKEELTLLKNTIEKHKIDKIGILTKNKIELKNFDDIIRFEAEVNYTKVILRDKSSIMVAKTLKIFDELLAGKSFVRVHQSHMVNFKYVEEFDLKKNEVILINGEKIAVSRRCRPLIIEMISTKLI